MESIAHPLDFHPKPLCSPINCFAAQYFPVLTIDQQTLLFTARMGQDHCFKENIYISHKNEVVNWTVPVYISPNINTEHNNGTCTIAADGKTLVFTSCSRAENYGICDLYISHKKGEEWTVPQNLGPNVNTSGWQSQPSLSANGKTLYFVSERSGNYGKRYL